MARLKRDARLETRDARARLKVQEEPYWRTVHRGLALGYRKGTRGGAWLVRRREGGRYVKVRLGTADDHADADGRSVLTFAQAQRLALTSDQLQPRRRGQAYTVDDAVADYLDWFQVHRKSYQTTRTAAEAHVLPKLGTVPVDELTTRRIRAWHQGLARTADDAEAKRRRRATANRVFTVLRAALNHAWRDGLVSSNQAWSRVKPFRNVDAPVVRHLSREEAQHLLNTADPDFRELIHAALMTGLRYGELCALVCGDFDPAAGTLTVRDSKAGRARHVPLTAEGCEVFEGLTVRRRSTATMLRRADGDPWGVAHQHRRMRETCERAGIDPPVSFHVLRHCYGSWLAGEGVSLQVIAAVLGHADTRMTERHYAHLQPNYVAATIRAHLPQLQPQRQEAKMRRIR